MKAKYIFSTAAILIIMALFTFCKKDPKEPEAIVVSTENVTVEAGKSVEVTISKGKSPFAGSSASQAIATVGISGNTVTINGIAAGETKVDITSADKATKQISVTVTAVPDNPFIDPSTINHEGFKEFGYALRFEFNILSDFKEYRNGETTPQYIYIKDAGQLFSSTKNKVGFGSKDGSSLMLIEWEGDASVGVKNNPSIRTLSGVTVLRYFAVLKLQDGVIWAVYQDESGAIGRFIQKW